MNDTIGSTTPHHLLSLRAWARREWRAPLAAAAVTLALIATTWPAAIRVGVFYDDAIYADLARALAQGDGYRHESLPGRPIGVHYPPLYPAWVAVWWWVADALGARDPFVAARVGNVLLAALAAALWTLWGTRRLGLDARLAAGVAALCMIVRPSRLVIDILYSEPFAWVLLALALLAQPAPASPERAGRRRRWVLESLLLGLLPVARTILLPFAAAAIIWRTEAQGRSATRRLAAAVLILGPTILWSLWVRKYQAQIPSAWGGNYGAYGAPWLAAIESWGQLRGLIALQLGELMRAFAGLFDFTTGIAVACIGIGLATLHRTQPWALWGTLGYAGILTVWPGTPSRFVTGLLPLLFLCGARGGVLVVNRLRAVPRARLLAPAVVLLPIVLCLAITMRNYRSLDWVGWWRRSGANYLPVIEWSRALPPGVPVVTEADGLFALATGRPTAPALPWDPLRYVGRARPAERVMEASLCAVGDGWVVTVAEHREAGKALQTLLAERAGRVRFDSVTRLGHRAIAAHFACDGANDSDGRGAATRTR